MDIKDDYKAFISFKLSSNQSIDEEEWSRAGIKKQKWLDRFRLLQVIEDNTEYAKVIVEDTFNDKKNPYRYVMIQRDLLESVPAYEDEIVMYDAKENEIQTPSLVEKTRFSLLQRRILGNKLSPNFLNYYGYKMIELDKIPSKQRIKEKFTTYWKKMLPKFYKAIEQIPADKITDMYLHLYVVERFEVNKPGFLDNSYKILFMTRQSKAQIYKYITFGVISAMNVLNVLNIQYRMPKNGISFTRKSHRPLTNRLRLPYTYVYDQVFDIPIEHQSIVPLLSDVSNLKVIKKKEDMQLDLGSDPYIEYQPPELVFADNNKGFVYDQKCEVFTVGMILLNLLTGKNNFDTDNIPDNFPYAFYDSNQFTLINRENVYAYKLVKSIGFPFNKQIQGVENTKLWRKLAPLIKDRREKHYVMFFLMLKSKLGGYLAKLIISMIRLDPKERPTFKEILESDAYFESYRNSNQEQEQKQEQIKTLNKVIYGYYTKDDTTILLQNSKTEFEIREHIDK